VSGAERGQDLDFSAAPTRLMPDDRVSEALDLERLRLTGAIEEINREYQRKMTEVAAGFRRRGLGISGPFAKAIADTQMARAKAIIGKHLELRRETLSKAPDVGTDESYQSLTVVLERTIDTASQSIDDHIQRQMGAALEGPPAASIARRSGVSRDWYIDSPGTAVGEAALEGKRGVFGVLVYRLAVMAPRPQGTACLPFLRRVPSAYFARARPAQTLIK
jgi:hypothetical protein